MLNDTPPQAQKLTPADVRSILHAVATPCRGCGRRLTYTMIGEAYGVSRVMVHHIATGRSWPDVPAPENDR